MLKNTIQKISNSASADAFLLILTGELFREILMVIQKIIAVKFLVKLLQFLFESCQAVLLMDVVVARNL